MAPALYLINITTEKCVKWQAAENATNKKISVTLKSHVFCSQIRDLRSGKKCGSECDATCCTGTGRSCQNLTTTAHNGASWTKSICQVNTCVIVLTSSVCLSICVYSGYIMHHFNGIWGTCAPAGRNMHHQGAIRMSVCLSVQVGFSL